MTNTTESLPEPSAAADTATYDVIVVGAGFTGIYQLRRLRERRFSVVLLEASDDLGGVWNLNRYPGARVDSHGPIYQFTDEELWRDWDFSQRFPDHWELRRYFDYVDSKLDLRKDCRFSTKVVAADFDDLSNTWTVEADTGATFRTRFLIFATGSSVVPYVPSFPGMESYRGTLVQTARWPEGLELSDQRIAVIGTGASGVQVIQEAGPVAEKLTVFQRTPNLSLPMQQRDLDDEDKAAIKQTLPEVFANCPNTFAAIDFDFDPRQAVDVTAEEREQLYETLWSAGGFRFWLATFADTMFSEDSNAMAYEFWKSKIRPRITDPAKVELLAPADPPHPFGTKRPALHQNYYEVMSQANVDIVSVAANPIIEFTENGIRTADGIERAFDIIVLATGYDNNTGALTSIEVRNTHGATLRDKWSNGVDAYLGAFTSGFPNLMFLYGPQSPAAFANGPTAAELQGDAVIDLIEFLRTNQYERVESSVEADTSWTAVIAELDDIALFRQAKSWYNASNIPGKHRQLLQYPGGFPAYLEHWRTEKESGYSEGLTLTGG